MKDKPLCDWPKLETLVRVESETLRGGKVVTQARYYISTLPPNQVEAVARGIRSHWGVENQLHWILDVVFNEDANRTRKGNGPECSAILRHIVLNLLRQDPNPKTGSIRYKRMLAAMSPDFLWSGRCGCLFWGGPAISRREFQSIPHGEGKHNCRGYDYL